MKAREIRAMSDAELREKLRELEDELFKLRFRAGIDPEVNPGKMRSLRREIARIRTIQREREPAAAGGSRRTGA
ncbi:MAG: 50S ribosomal protein L29 [Gemmatimonadetes bacterium]|nr:50S ribosomal protein L29 [Gemmatimonadota bacterium]